MYGDFEACYDVPYCVLYKGNKIDAFARGLKSKPYICLCNKEAIENKIKIFMKYYQYDVEVMDRTDMLLRELGLPQYYNDIIKASGVPYGLEWLKLIRFRENLCFECSISPIRKKSHYFYDLSHFEQNYEQEIEKHFYKYGIGYKLVKHYGIYFLKDQIPADLLQIIEPDLETMKKEIIEYASLDNCSIDKRTVEETLNKIFDEEEYRKNIVLYYQRDNKEELNPYDIICELQLDEAVMDYVEKCIWKRFLKVKKIIFDEVKELDRRINEEVQNGGKDIFLNIMKGENKILVIMEKLKRQIILEPSFDKRKRVKLTKEEFDTILDKLSFRKLSTWTKKEGDICKNISWSISGECGIEASIRNSGTEISEEIFNELISIFQILGAVEYLDVFI
jgi:hypothetical protein